MARAKAKYTIEADDKSARGIRSAEGRLRGFASKLKAGALVAAGAVGAAIAGWGKGLVDATNRMGELRGAAADLGQTLEEAQSVRLFAELQDSDPAQVNAAIERLKIRIGELVKGEETAVELFKELGLEADQLLRLTGLGQLLTVGGALRGAAPGRQAKLRDELTGGGTGRLFAGDFIGSAQRAGQLGLTDNLGELSRNADRTSDALTEFNALIKRQLDEGFLGEFSARAAEALRDAAVSLTQNAQDTNQGSLSIGGTRVETELTRIRTALEAGQAGRFVP